MAEDPQDEAPNTTGEGFSAITLILSDETIRHLLTGKVLTEDQYAEIVGAAMIATGAV